MAETEKSVTAPVAEVTEPKAPETPEVLDEEDEDEFEDEDEEEEEEEEEKLSDEKLKEIGDRIERFVTDSVPSEIHRQKLEPIRKIPVRSRPRQV